MKQGSTLILRGAVVLIGLSVLAICMFLIPIILVSDQTEFYKPLLAGLYVPAIPFFWALYQALKLLRLIDNSEPFSNDSANAFKQIKYCALIIGGIFLASSPYVYYVADQDDAPGVLLIVLVIAFASFVIATFSTLLQKLVQTAIDIKEENDLTV